MNTVSFVKMNGLGNDFVIIDAIGRDLLPDAKLIREISDRHFGVGCDQVLWLDTGSSGLLYRVFNSDGSEVGQCGNGARCVGHYMSLTYSYKDWPLLLETSLGSELLVWHNYGNNYSVDMGVPKSISASISDLHDVIIAGESLQFYAVDVGNPHAVFVNGSNIDVIGNYMQNHAMFSLGVNVSLARYVSDSEVCINVYERGVGQTLACGSAATAVVVVGVTTGFLRPGLSKVKMPGGNLMVDYNKEICKQSGPVDWVFVGSWCQRPENQDVFYYDFD